MITLLVSVLVCLGDPKANLEATAAAYDLAVSKADVAALDTCHVVFFATPNGIAMTQAAQLLAAGVRIVDLAADFRLRDRSDWEKWYGMNHICKDLLKDAVYGLPEMNRDKIKKAVLEAHKHGQIGGYGGKMSHYMEVKDSDYNVLREVIELLNKS